MPSACASDAAAQPQHHSADGNGNAQRMRSMHRAAWRRTPQGASAQLRARCRPVAAATISEGDCRLFEAVPLVNRNRTLTKIDSVNLGLPAVLQSHVIQSNAGRIKCAGRRGHAVLLAPALQRLLLHPLF